MNLILNLMALTPERENAKNIYGFKSHQFDNAQNAETDSCLPLS
jgi:hypothetical protein